MRNVRGIIAAAVAAGTLLPGLVVADAAKEVAFPGGYRDWRHIKTMTINAGHPLYEAVGGIHHIYANKKARAGYAAKRFSDGAVIVFDLYESVPGDNVVTEGAHKAVIVMQKNAKKFDATGGWGFQVFAGGDPAKPQLDDKGAAGCFSCHAAQKANDYVFSAPRD